MELEIVNSKTSKSYGKLRINSGISIRDLPAFIHKHLKGSPQPNRQSLRLEPRGPPLKDYVTLESLKLQNGDKIYIKDLGPQIGWKTVFLAEYAGPLFVYLIFYARPQLLYGTNADLPISLTTHIAATCYTVHYLKRLLETIFVHRFSHATMPMRNLFKNCSYYWGFTAYVAFHINHPLYTSPCMWHVWIFLFMFVLCELGNFSAHITLRNLRPPGTTIRRIPMPDRNPLTKLFDLVSCPNYTYEIGAWVAFSLMTLCLPAMMFTLAGAMQMTIWALGKHHNYRKEFKNYPKSRRAIFPYIL